MKELFQKYRELISYVFFGGMTTVVNYIIYFLCTRGCRIDPLGSNVLAWIGAVIFAYVVNKLYVFQSKSWERDLLIREIWQFVSARLASLGLEELMLFVFVHVLGVNDLIVKVGAAVVVVIANYFFSKLIIFKK